MKKIYSVAVCCDYEESYYILADDETEAERIAEEHFKPPTCDIEFSYYSTEVEKLAENPIAQRIRNSYPFDKSGNVNEEKTIGEILDEIILIEKQKYFVKENQLTLVT